MSPRITGWASINHNGDRVELPHSLDAKLEAYSPLPASPTDDATSSDRSPSPDLEPARKGDPDWVARPRNSFIIFRCEFARQHAGVGHKGKRYADDIPEKSLSKRASEAWKALPHSEKLRFQVMADLEKKQHAKDNPNYRFKPVRRPSSSRRSRRSSSSNSASAGPRLRRTLIARRQKSGRDSSTPSPSEYSATPTSSTFALPDTAATSASNLDFGLSDDLLKALKAAHRRSTSAPRLSNGSVPLSYEPASRMEFRRSKSITEGWQIPQQWPYDVAVSLTHNPTCFTTDSSTQSYLTTGNPQDFVPPDYVVTPPSPRTNLDFPALQVSPFTAVASSLTNWNGGNPPSSSQTDSQSPWPDSYSTGQAVASQQQSDFASPYSQPQSQSQVTNETMDPWATLPLQRSHSLYNLPNDPIQPYDPVAATLQAWDGFTDAQTSFRDQFMGMLSDEELFSTFLV